MEFSTEPFSPLKLGVPVNYYENILHDYKYIDHPSYPELFGEIEIDGELRFIKFSVKDGIVTAAELTEIRKQDSFCGASMSGRTKKFHKALANADIKADIDEDGIDLVDFPVGFFSESGKVASICWELPE